jgi:hypothetical protein
MRYGVWMMVACLAGCATPADNTYHMRNTLDGERLGIECQGDFDQEPKLYSGKAPVFPITMLNPTFIDDRKTRHLPMRWDIESSFVVDVSGKPAQVTSTETDPPSFGRHATVAISQWRFTPATRESSPVEARCAFAFHFALD